MENFLNRLGLNNETDREAIEEFSSMLNLLELKKGDYFLMVGKTSDRIGFVSAGMLKQYYVIDGEEKIRWVLIENDISMSLRSFTQNLPSLESIEAINKCRVCFISRKNWLYLLNKYDQFKLLWIKNIEDIFIGYEDRIYDLLSKDAKLRYDSFCHKFPEHAKKIPLQYLASILGISPQHLSKIRKF
jgi:CRP/FNR family transcriptional regulator, anaerobic regulatory protein